MLRHRLDRTIRAPHPEAQAEKHVHTHDRPGAHFVVPGGHRPVCYAFVEPGRDPRGGVLVVGAVSGGIGKFGLVDDPVDFLVVARKDQERGQDLALAINACRAG